jgi:CTP synthase (UTP-ammonia lyase)
MDPIRVGLIGDYNPDVPAHRAIPPALTLAARLNGVPVVEPAWLSTLALATEADQKLVRFAGLWCVPASPYASMEGALTAIRYARQNGVPFLGTCGGFQHALLEYARNVLGLTEADHAESNPASSLPLIARLACSLVEQEDRILLAEGSRIRHIYGRAEIKEPYRCSFGLNPRYEAALDDARLRFTGRDVGGEVRVFELVEHPFFIGTLFQPERSALRGDAHPLISAYVQALLRSYSSARRAVSTE